MAEGGDRRRPLPFKAKVELEPPASVVGDPIGSLEEIFMDEDARKKFKPKQRSLGRFHRKVFKTPKPLISLNKIVKRIKKLPLGERLELKPFDIGAVKKLENIIPIMGLENLDVHSIKFLEMFSFEESSAVEKAEFYKTVVDYLIALLTKGAGELVAPAVEPNEEGDDDDDDDDDEAAGEADGKVEEDGEGAADYSYSAEGENENPDDLEAAGANKDEEKIEPEVDEEQLILTTKAIVYATELEIYMCDLISLTESHYAKHKVNFGINLIRDIRNKCLDLSTAVQDYAEPLINKYSLQVFVDAVKSGKVKNMKKKFPVALYNQLKNRVILKPLTKEMACEDWEYCAVWLKMWLKMRDPQSAREQPGLDDVEECIICRKEFTFRDMTVLDGCDHACCLVCTERIARGKDIPKKRFYIAKCPLCNGYFRSWTTRTHYIEIRNKLKRLDAFKKVVPPNMIPQADVDDEEE